MEKSIGQFYGLMYGSMNRLFRRMNSMQNCDRLQVIDSKIELLSENVISKKDLGAKKRFETPNWSNDSSTFDTEVTIDDVSNGSNRSKRFLRPHKNSFDSSRSHSTDETDDEVMKRKDFVASDHRSPIIRKQQKQEINIRSMKDLIEVLIYNLQIQERRIKELESIQNQLEETNEMNRSRSEILEKEIRFQMEKNSFLKRQLWFCTLCSRDKWKLYAANTKIVALLCGHLFCDECCNQNEMEKCPFCDGIFQTNQIVYL